MILGNDVHSLSFSPSAEHLAVGIGGRMIEIFHMRSGTSMQTFYPRITCRITRLAYTPDGSYLAVGNNAGLLHLLNLKTGALL